MKGSFLILPLLLFGAAGRTRETGLAKPKAGRTTGPACGPLSEPSNLTAAIPEDPAQPAPLSRRSSSRDGPGRPGASDV
jgi:hypothetical protein